jgi:hypothetical protein
MTPTKRKRRTGTWLCARSLVGDFTGYLGYLPGTVILEI